MDVDSSFALDHQILLIDANLARPLDGSRKDSITSQLVEGLLATLGMQTLGPLEVYPATDLRAPGWSFFQPITTSHISGDYFNLPGEPPQMHVDVYTCASLDRRQVVRVINDHLELADWVGTLIDRNLDLQCRRSLEMVGRGGEVLREYPLASRRRRSLKPKPATATDDDARLAAELRPG